MEEKHELLFALSKEINGMWELFFASFSGISTGNREEIFQEYLKHNNNAHILMSELATALDKKNDPDGRGCLEKKSYRLFRL